MPPYPERPEPGAELTGHAAAHARARRRAEFPALQDFSGGLDLVLDDFQVQACRALERGHGVLVAAPTGAGKTIVGEFAVHLALRGGRKCFYTTPIKALSNQKYHDLVRTHGADQVGLLTGDRSENGEAPIVVMTTEVLRNMLYAGSQTLGDLGFVVMDEVHYLADRLRGAVWEEVIIHLPASVALVSLSATVSNAEEFGAWLVAVRGDTEVVVSDVRPVPLWQHMLVGNRMFDLFAIRRRGDSAGRASIDPDLARSVHAARERLAVPVGRGRRGGPPRGRSWRPTARAAVVERLDREGLLPAINFVFSRAGCDAAVAQCLAAGLRLTTDAEAGQVEAIIAEHCAQIPDDDLRALGFHGWAQGLHSGIAAHHAGLVPAFKETVEELFRRGLVKVVFATETLALGINMPARSVVLERLSKWDGDRHAPLTPGEYTQLTGRAGRRGIDIDGHAVVVWSPEVDPEAVGGLATTRTYPLRSSFRPSYNMAVNLVAQLGRDAARDLLGSSFAQFQADRAVVGINRQIAANEPTLTEFADAMTCDRGDLGEYEQIRMTLSRRESELSREGAHERRTDAVRALEGLRVGDVIRVPHGRRHGLAVVLDPGLRPGDDPSPLVLTEGRWAGRLSTADFSSGPKALAHVRVPKRFDHRSPVARRDLASSLRNVRAEADLGARRTGGNRRRSRAADDDQIADLRAQLRAHPCHLCPDREEHATWARRYSQLDRDTGRLREQVEERTGSIARAFDRICALLTERGYLTGAPPPDALSADGRRLTRIWSETDLLTAECLRAGAFDGLGPAELAGAVSALVYESRRDRPESGRVVPGSLGRCLETMERLADELRAEETRLGLALTRELDPGFVRVGQGWARGQSLNRVLREAAEDGIELTGGDFVRWARQLVDALGQISRVAAADPASRQVAAAAESALTALRRGVVAAAEPVPTRSAEPIVATAPSNPRPPAMG